MSATYWTPRASQSLPASLQFCESHSMFQNGELNQPSNVFTDKKYLITIVEHESTDNIIQPSFIIQSKQNRYGNSVMVEGPKIWRGYDSIFLVLFPFVH